MDENKSSIVGALILIAIAAFVVVTTTGCQDRFRYPCQDPANWETPRCQRPLCAITQECPDQLIKPEEMKGDVR